MEGFRQWAFDLCGTTVICGIVACLLPEKSPVKTLIVLYLLCAMLVPLKNVANFSIDFSIEKQEEISSRLMEKNEQLAYSIAEDHILKLTQETLEENNFPAEQLQITLDAEDDRPIIYLKLDLPETMHQKEWELRNLLRSICGIEKVEINWQEVT